jgi:hypothetical protein
LGAPLLTLDNAGKLSVTGDLSYRGLTMVMGTRSASNADANVLDFYSNGAASPGYDRNTYCTWMTRMQHAGGDNFQVLRRPAGSDTYNGMLIVTNDASLQIYGNNATKNSGTTWINPSDPRLKRDIAPYTHGLADILQLEPISFQYNGKGGTTDDGRRCYGYDATVVRGPFPEAVGTRRGKLTEEDADETDLLTLDTSNFTLALVNAVKELAARVAALEGAPA